MKSIIFIFFQELEYACFLYFSTDSVLMSKQNSEFIRSTFPEHYSISRYLLKSKQFWQENSARY